MRPERVLGHDPTPGDLEAVDAVAGVLREVVLALAQSRQRLEHSVGTTSLWCVSGSDGVAGALQPLLSRLRHVEDAVVELARACQRWRTGLAERSARTAELVEAMAARADDAGAEQHRASLEADARALAAEHERAAADLAAAAEQLMESLADPSTGTADVVADLGHALGSVSAEVERWMSEGAAALGGTVAALQDAAGLTASVSSLLGIGGPADAAPPALAQAATGAHRLGSALATRWPDVPVEELAEASFADAARPSLAQRLGARPQEEPEDRT